MPRLMRLVFLLAVTAVVAGCGSSDDRKVIRLMVFETGESRKLIDRVIERFEAEHPEFRVKVMDTPSNGYSQKLYTMYASNTQADITEARDVDVAELAKRNRLLDIGPRLRENGLSLDDFFEEPLYMYRYDGKRHGRGRLYGLAKDWSPTCTLLYNERLLRESGIRFPDRSMSWEEYHSYAKKLTRRDSKGRLIQVGALSDYAFAPPVFQSLLHQNGASFFNAAGTRLTLDTPEALDTMRFWVKLREDCSLRTAEGGQSLEQLVGSGKVATMFGARFMLAVIDGLTEDKWKMAPSLHRDPARRANYVWPPVGYMVNKDTRYPREATALLLDLCAGYGQEETAKLGWNIPIHKKAAQGRHFAGNAKDGEANRTVLREVECAYPFLFPAKLNSAEFNDDYNLAVQEIVARNADIARTMRKLCERYNERLSKQ